MHSITALKRRAETSRAVLLSLAMLAIAACRDTPVVTEPAAIPIVPGTPATPTTRDVLFISGAMGPQYQSIRLAAGDTTLTDAKVTVNGFPLTYCCSNLYTGTLPEAVPGGGKIYLKVVVGAVTYKALGETIPTPVITEPATGSTFASTDYVSLFWSTPADPDKFEVCLNCWPNSNEGEIYTTSGSTRAFTIAPGHLVDYEDETVVAVFAFKRDFLKSVDTPEIRSDVLFVTRSGDAHIHVRH